MFKKIFIIMICFLAVMGVTPQVASAQAVAIDREKITYVALGDSIAEGYAINLKTKGEDEDLIGGGDEDYSFVENSYPYLIKEELEKSYNVTPYNYSYSGDTCQDLINFINEFYDDSTHSCKNQTDANPTYPTISNLDVYNSLAEANILTICIGANNILSGATSLITRFLGIESPSITRAEMEETLKVQILGDGNTKGLKSEFQELLSLIYEINPNAKVYFTSIYNPYKVLDAQESLLSMCKLFLPQVTQENLNIISEVTELAIAGGRDSQENDFTGINNVLSQEISTFNTSHSSNNFTLIDSKALFDEKFDNTSTETRKTYNNYVNVRLDEVTSNALLGGGLDASLLATNYLDPHPTTAGHELIFNAHKGAGLQVYLKDNSDPPQQTITIKFVTGFDKYISSQTLPINSKISKPKLERNGYIFAGWFCDKDFNQEWDFNQTASTSMTLYAKWTKPNTSMIILISLGTIAIISILCIIVAIHKHKKSVF